MSLLFPVFTISAFKMLFMLVIPLFFFFLLLFVNVSLFSCVRFRLWLMTPEIILVRWWNAFENIDNVSYMHWVSHFLLLKSSLFHIISIYSKNMKRKLSLSFVPNVEHFWCFIVNRIWIEALNENKMREDCLFLSNTFLYKGGRNM